MISRIISEATEGVVIKLNFSTTDDKHANCIGNLKFSLDRGLRLRSLVHRRVNAKYWIQWKEYPAEIMGMDNRAEVLELLARSIYLLACHGTLCTLTLLRGEHGRGSHPSLL